MWAVPYQLAASPAFIARALGGKRTLDRKALAELPAIVTRSSPWRLLGRGGRVETVKPRARFVVADPRVAVSAAASGLGIVCAPAALVAEARLESVSIRGFTAEARDLFAVYPSRRLLAPRVRLALDWVLRAAPHPA